MTGCRLLKDAAFELEQATEYYEECSKGLGLEFLDEFERSLDLVIEMPEAWSKVDESFRRFFLRRFPYVILYRVDGDFIIVTSVFHQHRKPNSWRSNR
ncbi:MAG: type II toxin-antitoxin system RelE/ParE family toxin [Akkermansiaceae bacterium]|jgi:plasmid stabilization system protein ParE